MPTIAENEPKGEKKSCFCEIEPIMSENPLCIITLYIMGFPIDKNSNGYLSDTVIKGE